MKSIQNSNTYVDNNEIITYLDKIFIGAYVTYRYEFDRKTTDEERKHLSILYNKYKNDLCYKNNLEKFFKLANKIYFITSYSFRNNNNVVTDGYYIYITQIYNYFFKHYLALKLSNINKPDLNKSALYIRLNEKRERKIRKNCKCIGECTCFNNNSNKNNNPYSYLRSCASTSLLRAKDLIDPSLEEVNSYNTLSDININWTDTNFITKFNNTYRYSKTDQEDVFDDKLKNDIEENLDIYSFKEISEDEYEDKIINIDTNLDYISNDIVENTEEIVDTALSSEEDIVEEDFNVIDSTSVNKINSEDEDDEETNINKRRSLKKNKGFNLVSFLRLIDTINYRNNMFLDKEYIENIFDKKESVKSDYLKIFYILTEVKQPHLNKNVLFILNTLFLSISNKTNIYAIIYYILRHEDICHKRNIIINIIKKFDNNLINKIKLSYDEIINN